MRALWLLGAVAGAAAAALPASASEDRKGAHGRLGQAIHQALEEEGPFLTSEEQALIERKCGYAPGSSDGKNLSISDGVLHCSNGRKVDDPEVRAMMAVVSPRIERRVKAIMARPEIQEAISGEAARAAAEALREVSRKWGE